MAIAVVYIVAWLAGLLLVLFVGSALLRVSVALVNKSIGPVKSDEPIGWDWDADEDDEDVLPPENELAVPEPGIGLGMRVLFLAVVAQLAAVVALQFVLREIVEIRRGVESGPGVVLSIASGFLLLSLVASWMLPASFGRATLVALFFYLILLVIGGLVGGLLFVVFD